MLHKDHRQVQSPGATARAAVPDHQHYTCQTNLNLIPGEERGPGSKTIPGRGLAVAN